MAVRYAVPPIITDGLVLYLDAANRQSYVSGSTTWYDAAGSNISGSLINGPTFSPDNAGSIVFDGTNDYVNCGNSTNLQITEGTIECWFKGQQQGSNFNGILVKQDTWGLFINGGNLVTYDWGNTQKRDTGVGLNSSTWYHAVMVFTQTTGTPSNNATLYLNSTLILTTTIRNLSQGQPLLVGYGNSTDQYLLGSVANVKIYNRTLSASEILQNYNSTKARFGL